MATSDPADPGELRAVETSAAPAPVGPYSQAVIHGDWVFVSGQIPLDPNGGSRVTGSIEEQTGRVLENLRAVLEAADSSLDRVLRTTLYLADLELFPRVNAVYARYFVQEPRPARSTVQVARLPLDAQIEIDAIASRRP